MRWFDVCYDYIAFQLLPLGASAVSTLTQVLALRALPKKPFYLSQNLFSEDPNLQRFRIPFLEQQSASGEPRFLALTYSSEG